MKTRVAFICIGNSCRSQMAEGFAREYGNDVLEVFSAGTHPADRVNPKAVEVMQELSIDISNQQPKFIDDIFGEINILITMGCGVECPNLPSKTREDWDLDDPVGQPLTVFRQTRDIIEEKVRSLISEVKNN